VAGHAVVGLSAAVQAAGSRTGPLGTASSVALLQLVGLGGTWRYLRGDRPALWPKGERPCG